MNNKILLIGASTGGPSLIKEMISEIETLSSTIIIAQHMKEDVLPFFIKDIQSTTHLKVCCTPAVCDFYEPSIIICSSSCIVKQEVHKYHLIEDKSSQHYTPDIDKLFTSFASLSDTFDIEVLIMTGIGRDGLKGARELKKHGAKIYAQDEKSSPVFGMPKAVIEDGLADDIKSFAEIKRYIKGL